MGLRKHTTIIVSLVFILAIVLPAMPVSAADAYRTRSQILSDFLALEAAYPTLMSHVIIGSSVELRDIYLFTIGNVDGGYVLIDAAIHGNEHASTETLYYLIEWLLTSMTAEAQRILEQNCVLVIPMVNVDGYGTSRYNAQGVDLNRNFETGWGVFNDYARGPFPLSEPETQALHNILLAYDVTWYLNLHTGDYCIKPPWAYQPGVPEEATHQQVYDAYETISTQRGEYAIPYRISGNYAGGTARDEGYATGAAYTYCVELQSELKPGIHVIQSKMVPQLISLTIAVCQASETGAPDTEPPLISEIATSELTTSSATVTWNTNEPSDSMVVYGLTSSLGSTISDPTLVTAHSLSLTDLSAATTYYYAVHSTDAAGNTAIANNGGAYYTFTTLPPDTTPPTIQHATGDTVGTTGDPVTIAATISDDVGVTAATVVYTPIAGSETALPMADAASEDVWSVALPVAIDHVGTITYYITAQDGGGNIARDPLAGTYSIIVDDDDAPAAEAGPNQLVPVDDLVYVDGSLSTDNIGITLATWDFDARDGLQEDAVGMTASHAYSVEGTYIVTLTIEDAAGNRDVDTLEVRVAAPPTATLDISMSKEENSRKGAIWSRAAATVTVLVDGMPLKDATVYGSWSGAYDEQVTGTTTGKGEMTFKTPWMEQAGTYTFTVIRVHKDGVDYLLTGEPSSSI